MNALRVERADSTHPELEGEGVAGLIKPAGPDDLDNEIELWLAGLARKKRSPDTIRSYRAHMKRARKHRNWSRISQVTYVEIVAYLDERQSADAWSGSTYNCNLTMFRSFARHLARAGKLDDASFAKVMASERMAVDEQEGDGGRAATTEEARAIIQAAVEGTLDGRATSPRDLVWLSMFVQGLRGNEPSLLKWKHLRLDDPVPHIRWGAQKGWDGCPHKAKRRIQQALAPEFCALISRYRKTVRNGPEDRVFPIMPAPHQWGTDREAAGIERYRGGVESTSYAFVRRSARKWLTTTLTAQGVSEKLTDFIMRHRGKAEARYYDASLEEQQEALRTLPRLYPEKNYRSEQPPANLPKTPENTGGNETGKCAIEKRSEKSEHISLDEREQIDDTHAGNHSQLRGTNPAQSRIGTRPAVLLRSSGSPPCYQGSRAGHAKIRSLPGSAGQLEQVGLVRASPAKFGALSLTFT